jgi:hypothetical protein
MFDFDGPISDVDHRLVNIDPYSPSFKLLSLILQILYIHDIYIYNYVHIDINSIGSKMLTSVRMIFDHIYAS